MSNNGKPPPVRQGKAMTDLGNAWELGKKFFFDPEGTAKEALTDVMRQQDMENAKLQCGNKAGEVQCSMKIGHKGCRCPGKEPCDGCTFDVVCETVDTEGVTE